uniref:Vomeronasal type-2 receptor 116-like n=1 Tax=Nannospalax galili TaxID=1026970 RepID=A0A8C6W6Y0_NANGA
DYQFVLALRLATKEINRNTHLLPNITLIFWTLSDKNFDAIVLSDTLISLGKDGEGVPNYTCITKASIIAVLTGPLWSSSSRLGLYFTSGFMPIAFGSFYSILSDDEQFPYLYQMEPKDTYLASAMVSLMAHFSWNWVGLVVSDDEQGVQFLSDFRGQMKENRVCLAFVNMIPLRMQLYMTRAHIYYEQIMTSSANVVVIYGNVNSTLAESYRWWKYLGIRRIWFSTSQWDNVINQRDFNIDSSLGTFTFSHHHGEISGFKNFIQTLKLSDHSEKITLTSLGWIGFNCSVASNNFKTLKDWSSNTSFESLMWHNFNMAMSDESYNIYNAVYAVAHSLHEMLLYHVDMQPVAGEKLKFQHWQVVWLPLYKIQFINPAGDTVTMNQKEKPHGQYDIFNILCFSQGLRTKVKIGEFSPFFPHGQQLYLSEDMIEWVGVPHTLPSSVCSVSCSPGSRKSPQKGKATCCFDCTPCPENEISNQTDMDQCVQCPDDQYANVKQNHCIHKSVMYLAYEDPLGMSLTCMALFLTALAVVMLGVFVKHRDTPIVKANNRTLSYILLLSLIFCFLCSLLFIGHPNTITCVLQQTTFGLAFTVAVSTVLAKTLTVVLAFKVTVPGRRLRGLLVSGAPSYIIPICTLIQLILCGVWMGTSPPFIVIDPQSELEHITIVCNKGSVTVFYCVLGYLGSLALGAFTVAFMARNLPDTFNEAKFLTFSMLVFCSVWVTFLPVYHSTKGKAMVAVEVFSILASSAGLLGCIFAPKCFIILLRSDQNSLQNFR